MQREVAHCFGGSVGRVVIDEYDFIGNPGEDALEAFHDAGDVGLLIVGGDDHGEFQDARGYRIG